MQRSGSPQVDPATVDEAFILDRWLNKHWGHPAIFRFEGKSLPEAEMLRSWLDMAFEQDFERWKAPDETGEDKDIVLDIQPGEIRVPEPHEGWMPPQMLDRDIQGIFG